MPDEGEVTSTIDTTRSTFISIFGRKGSGKSFLAARFWATWPFDRIAIDPTGDADVGDEVERLEAPLPGRWPWRHDDKRSSLHFVPDPGAPDYEDELDRALGLAWSHPKHLPVLAWLDEVGDLTKANGTPPFMRRVLHQGRHRKISMLMCGPRPIDINPLVISQADYVYVFSMPHPRDKERVAGNIGVPPKEFEKLVDGLGEYEYLRYESRAKELVHFPPLPTRAPR